MTLPSVVAHADWSLGPSKRWVASAQLDEETGAYTASGPERVGDASTLLQRLAQNSRGGSVLAGFDFPIGVPLAYAKAAGIESFPRLLPELGWGLWRDFYRVAERPQEISLYRPFYPQRPGGTSQAHLIAAFGVSTMDQLLRVSDRRTAVRKAACCLFWTLGGNQVGKAAISGWRDLLAPGLRDPSLDIALWPFEGCLDDLLGNRQIIVAETYPTEFYGHIGIAMGGSKRDQVNRANQAERFEAWRREPGIEERVVYAPDAAGAIAGGFGQGEEGEDPFDAFVGLLGMLNVVLGRRDAGWPVDSQLRELEGWILGQSPPADEPDPYGVQLRST